MPGRQRVGTYGLDPDTGSSVLGFMKPDIPPTRFSEDDASSVAGSRPVVNMDAVAVDAEFILWATTRNTCNACDKPWCTLFSFLRWACEE